MGGFHKVWNWWNVPVLGTPRIEGSWIKEEVSVDVCVHMNISICMLKHVQIYSRVFRTSEEKGTAVLFGQISKTGTRKCIFISIQTKFPLSSCPPQCFRYWFNLILCVAFISFRKYTWELFSTELNNRKLKKLNKSPDFVCFLSCVFKLPEMPCYHITMQKLTYFYTVKPYSELCCFTSC